MLTKSVLALSAIALATTAALLFGQGSGSQQQGFTDCDLDIRPQSRPEVQVYWTDAPSGMTGMQFQLWSAQDEVVTIGYPDGADTTPPALLKKGWVNTVTYRYVTTTSPPTVEMSICTDATPANCQTWKPIPLIGSYNPALPLEEPTEERARPPQVQGAERLLIIGHNYGLEFSFTLTRVVP